jgi:TRAP-type C4-dicarboxylate transport system permease small subunit
LKAWLEKWAKVERWAAVITLGLMALLMIIDVIGRETGLDLPVGFQKSALYLMIWGAFLGVALSRLTRGRTFDLNLSRDFGPKPMSRS